MNIKKLIEKSLKDSKMVYVINKDGRYYVSEGTSVFLVDRDNAVFDNRKLLKELPEPGKGITYQVDRHTKEVVMNDKDVPDLISTFDDMVKISTTETIFTGLYYEVESVGLCAILKLDNGKFVYIRNELWVIIKDTYYGGTEENSGIVVYDGGVKAVCLPVFDRYNEYTEKIQAIFKS